MENLNTLNKQKLIELVGALQEDKTKLETTIKETLMITNYFAAKLVTIESLLNGLPPKGNGRQLLWFISNAKKLANFLEGLIAQIREWRSEVNKLQKTEETPVEPTDDK